jgi:hypothetical protein
METRMSVADQEQVESFYRRVAEEARSKGIVINTVSIEGEDCKLENLGILADLTSGKARISYHVFCSFLRLLFPMCSVLYDDWRVVVRGGTQQVDIVDPLQLEKNFDAILEKPTIAKNVRLHFLLSAHMYVRSSDASVRPPPPHLQIATHFEHFNVIF